MRQFLTDRRGNVAMMFSLSLLPIIAVAGSALDYVRASDLRSEIQVAADASALQVAGADAKTDSAALLAAAESAMRTRLAAEGRAEGLTMKGSWISPTDYRVTASSASRNAVLGAVPGGPQTMQVEAEAIARVYQPIQLGFAPTVSSLDPEAGDYNQIAVYCFDVTKVLDPKTSGRTQITTIADNGGTKYAFEVPTCKAGETLSYRLRNVRGARSNPKLWDGKKGEVYEYHTDTTMVGYNQVFNMVSKPLMDLKGFPILETVLCDTLDQCKPKSAKGILPEGKNRDVSLEAKACEPGKFMYYGWEDRPPVPGQWTDKDYDDIRIVVECPKVVRGEKVVRLID